jgi:FMN phosphatase YigB (HAD superfamily)
MSVEDAVVVQPASRTNVAGAALTSPVEPHGPIRAVLFDLDGTLYEQRRMRVLMAMELATLLVTHPFSARRRLRALAAYRKAQEALRSEAGGAVSPRTQIELAAKRSGVPVDEVDALVDEWMFRRPLKYLPSCRAEGLLDLLSLLDRTGTALGVLSDYPAAAKLGALGIGERFSLVLCSSDADVGRLKPDPRGFLRAAERWQIDPGEVLVVGDRVEVDGLGAVAAAMPCVIIGRPPQSGASLPGVRFLPSLERLRGVLDPGR